MSLTSGFFVFFNFISKNTLESKILIFEGFNLKLELLRVSKFSFKITQNLS